MARNRGGMGQHLLNKLKAVKWRELVPHFFAMMMLYIVFVIAAMSFGVQHFFVSLAIALAIAFTYPPLVRQLGVAPSAWER